MTSPSCLHLVQPLDQPPNRARKDTLIEQKNIWMFEEKYKRKQITGFERLPSQASCHVRPAARRRPAPPPPARAAAPGAGRPGRWTSMPASPGNFSRSKSGHRTPDLEKNRVEITHTHLGHGNQQICRGPQLEGPLASTLKWLQPVSNDKIVDVKTKLLFFTALSWVHTQMISNGQQ